MNTYSKYTRFKYPEGSATFSIHQLNKLPNGEGIVVYFEYEDLDDYVDKLIHKGIQFDELPTDQSRLWRDKAKRS